MVSLLSHNHFAYLTTMFPPVSNLEEIWLRSEELEEEIPNPHLCPWWCFLSETVLKHVVFVQSSRHIMPKIVYEGENKIKRAIQLHTRKIKPIRKYYMIAILVTLLLSVTLSVVSFQTMR